MLKKLKILINIPLSNGHHWRFDYIDLGPPKHTEKIGENASSFLGFEHMTLLALTPCQTLITNTFKKINEHIW